MLLKIVSSKIEIMIWEENGIDLIFATVGVVLALKFIWHQGKGYDNVFQFDGDILQVCESYRIILFGVKAIHITP